MVIQKLVAHQPALVELLDALIDASDMEKAFLFDPRTKLLLSTDHNPVDPQTLSLCSDLVEVQADLEGLFSNVPITERRSRASLVARLNPDVVLLSERLGRRATLVAVLRREAWTGPKPVLTRRNISLLRGALIALYSSSIQSGSSSSSSS